MQMPDAIKYVPSKRVAISKILFDENNPNKMTDAQMAGLEKFMKKRGFAVEVWLNEQSDGNYTVIDGEHRIRVLIKNGIKYVHAKIFKVPYTEHRMMRQIANKLSGEHDKKQDALEFKEIFDKKQLENFAEFLGEPIEEFEKILEKNFDITFAKPETEEIPAPPQNPKAKRGQLYILGEHRLLCGDALLSEDVKKLFNGSHAQQLVTDPPYGVDYSSKNEFLNKADKGNRIQTPITNDNISDYQSFFRGFLELAPLSVPNTAYVFMGNNELHTLRLAAEEAGYTYSQYLVWVKNNHVLGRNDYLPKHEMIYYGWKEKHKFYGLKDTTVLSYDKPQVNDLHPTMKPVELLSRLIKDGSKKDDIVYDPFGGSGSTIIACEGTNRICYAVEMEPAYCDVIIERWENYTGKKAIKK